MAVEEDQIRVNVLPKKLADGENAALTTPMSSTGTAAELDAQLPDAMSVLSPVTKWMAGYLRRGIVYLDNLTV